MNDEPLKDAELEKELRLLKPAAVSPDAMRRWKEGFSEEQDKALESCGDEIVPIFRSKRRVLPSEPV